MVIWEKTRTSTPSIAQWVFANLAGWLTGMLLGVTLTLLGGRLNWVNEDRFLVYAILIGVGLAMSIAQWLVIRQFLPRAWRWVPATFLGYMLALLVVVILNRLALATGRPWSDALLLALIGAAIALPQWWLLRAEYPAAAIWVAASIVGFMAFLFLVSRNPSSSIGEFVLLCTLVGMAAAIVPGIVLAWLVEKRAFSAGIIND